MMNTERIREQYYFNDLLVDLQQKHERTTSTEDIIHRHNKTDSNFENRDRTPHSYNQSQRTKRERETIKFWCIGKVIRINEKDGYFEASLKDIKNKVELIAEFSIDAAFDDDDDKKLTLYPNATFIYYISQIHGYGSPKMEFKFEFKPPYIWQKNDGKKAAEKYRELFPDDPEIN
ncbi:MAG: hypothetical protein HQL05_00475 [Nitrospirae bacterium]|uniref:hypothetical protein n=1 Tax=Candidatus Magnetobacterium casense TaxID=1455061 RepID=UPI00058BB99E|nr:hypothetical protein [Candidatus Magnetobacterium casensis]MBF0336281.1 hypothetical protein [Nitrospirota bacterium]